jgi:hypothetical protein
MVIAYDCETCDVTVTFESTDQRAIGNASYENCQCPTCGTVLGDIRDDWSHPKVLKTEPRSKK